MMASFILKYTKLCRQSHTGLTLLLLFAPPLMANQPRFVTEIMSPFQVKEGRKLTGFAVELIEEIKHRVKIKARIEVYPWARAYHLALTTPNVFIFTLVKTPDRLAKFDWIDQYYVATDSFYALASRQDIVIKTIDDAKNYSICIPRNDVGEQRLLKLGFNHQLKKVAFQSQCLGMLYRNRVDLNLFNQAGIDSLSRKFEVDPNRFRRILVVSKAVMGVAASKNSDIHLVAEIRRSLADIKAEPNFHQRIEKWFAPAEAQ